ncbi:unnamed protein product, partial [Rotaria sp. Silwood2]
MKTYNFRINRPKLGDGFFTKLHLREFSDDQIIQSKTKASPKTRWLRGIAGHIQQVIFRATADRAKGQKRIGKIALSNAAVVASLEQIGITNKWVACPDIIQLLNLHTSFIKG